MYLIVLDVIESRSSKTLLANVFTTKQRQDFIIKYGINPNYVEIGAGDAIRIIHNDTKVILEMIFYLLTLLHKHHLNARVFITVGNVEYAEPKHISTMYGDIFYKNKNLEMKAKAHKEKNSIILYEGNDKSSEINLLCISFSKLILNKMEYIETIYKYRYEQKTQKQIAFDLGLSQSTVANQLLKSNYQLYNQFESVIINQIEEDLR